jgi:hypothetical protein
MSIAEQALARALRRRLARSVVIKDADAYQALYGQLQTAMTNAWSGAMREGIAASLDRLRDLGPGAFTPEDGAMILRVLEGSVGEEAIRAAMREPVINLTDALYRVGAEEVGQATGVAINFMRPDLDAMDALSRGNLFWVGESWNTQTRDRLNTILTEYFTDGMTREGLAERIAQDFATSTSRSEVYWEMLADHIATKGREIGRVTGYERAGISRVQVRAQLDGRTSEICKAMHGRIITVSAMRQQADDYIEAANRGDRPTIERVWTMHGRDADLSGIATRDLQGTASPPYHFRCRTITVAYFGPVGGDEISDLRQRVVDREDQRPGDRALVRGRASDAGFMRTTVARRKYQEHRANLPTRRFRDYETDARALIADPASQVLLSARVPGRSLAMTPGEVAVHAVFARPLASRHTGADGYIVTVVDLEENTIISHHWRNGLSSGNDITAAQPVTKRKGFWSWLTP